MNEFIKELQALEEKTKKRILVVGTIFAMAIVMYLWVGYFGSLITAIPQEQPAVAQTDVSGQNQSGASAPAQQNGPSFLDKMRSGAANIYDTLKGPQQYDVTPSQ